MCGASIRQNGFRAGIEDTGWRNGNKVGLTAANLSISETNAPERPPLPRRPNSDGDHAEHHNSRRGQLPHLFVPQRLWYSQSLLKRLCFKRVGLGFHHAAFAIKSEGHLDRSPNFSKHIPRGELVDLLSKALLYIEVETHWCEGSLTLNCRAPFSLLDKHTCDIDGAMKPAALRIPPESTTRLLNSLRPVPPVNDDDEGTPRRAEEDGMDVDSQAEAQAEMSADTREQEVPGVQLHDGSKSAVRYLSSLAPSRFFLRDSGLRVWLEPNKHEHTGNWVGPPRYREPLGGRTDVRAGQRTLWCTSGTYHPAPRTHPRLPPSHFRTSPTKTSET